MNTRNCATCGQEFIVLKQKPNQSFCSRECWRQSLFKQVERICETCGKTFSVYQARGNARFCSHECLAAKIELHCKWCGKPFYVKRSVAPKRLTCSRSCLLKLRAQEKRSPRQGQKQSSETRKKVSDGLKRYYSGDPSKHWNFHNGPFAQRRGVHSFWQNQRILARTRDNFTCRICNKTETELRKQLSVHHIKPFRFFVSVNEANELDNLICLCQSCHMKMEHNKITLPEQSPTESTSQG